MSFSFKELFTKTEEPEKNKIKKKKLGETHADTIMMYGQIGRLYHDMGNFEQARPLLAENLRSRLNILDPYHPQSAVAKNPLAALLVALEIIERAYFLQEILFQETSLEKLL